MSHSLALGLPFWIGEEDPDEFLARDYEQRARHFPSDRRARFDGLLSADQFLDEEPSGAKQVRSAARDRRGWNREVSIQPRDARKMYELGFTVGLTALNPQGRIAPLLQGFEASFESPSNPHVNAYLSPDGGGYGIHFDTHPVWIFQLEGVKRWTYSIEPEIVDPPFNVLFPPDRERVRLPWIELDRPDISNREKFREVCLQPGEALYLPAGCWHGAVAEGHSLALTLAMGRATALELALLALRAGAAGSVEALGRRLPAIPRRPGPHRERLTARLDSDLQAIRMALSVLQAEDLRQSFEASRRGAGTPPQSELLDSRGQVQQMKQSALGARTKSSTNWLEALSPRR